MRRTLPLVLMLATACAATLYEQQVSDTLYFGTNRPGGVVSEIEWRQFVREEITPRFPGFTVWEARGAWKGEEEATHVVQIVHPRGGDAGIRAIIEAYKKRFAQEDVLVVRDDVRIPR